MQLIIYLLSLVQLCWPLPACSYMKWLQGHLLQAILLALELEAALLAGLIGRVDFPLNPDAPIQP